MKTEDIIWFGKALNGYNIATPAVFPAKGNFLLKDGNCSPHSVYNKEAGIFITPDLYVQIEHMTPQALSAAGAAGYCKAFDVEIPDAYEILQLQNALQEVNASLEAVGMRGCKLPDNIFDVVWYKEIVNSAEENLLRRVVVIKSKGNLLHPAVEFCRNYTYINDVCCESSSVMLIDDSEVYIKRGGNYVPGKLELLASSGNLDLLECNGELFEKTGLDFYHVGSIAAYARDVIVVDGKAYQIKEGTLQVFHEFGCCCSQFDNEGRFLIHNYVDEKFPDGQSWNESDDYIYEKDESGCYVLIDHQHK